MPQIYQIENIQGFTLHGLSKLSVILGKNGSGKSHLLKQLELGFRNSGTYGKVMYISPERGGSVKYEPNIEQAMGDPNWINNSRRVNQSQNFRQQSATLFRRLELSVLREIEAEHQLPEYQPKTFENTIAQLNNLLDRIYISRDVEQGFKLQDKITNAVTSADLISSGESELISLGIEMLSFVKTAMDGPANIILIDEPDVHLHPDLQHRLARFIVDVCNDKNVIVILATHSTALLAGLAESSDCSVAFMKRNDQVLSFKFVSAIDKAILPIFGAHPLSNVFNQAPILLVEGNDDDRVWQQAVRSGQGKIRFYPCPVDSIGQLAAYENEVNELVGAVYDNPTAYSMRDRDEAPELIEDLGSVIRMRLSCRAAENLMLSDDVLVSAGSTWEQLQADILIWIAGNPFHKYHANMKAFADLGFDRSGADLKEIRNIILGLISNKPWEVLVGQSIATLAKAPTAAAANSLREYLGAKVCNHLLGIT
jgi:predicted ATPase